MASKCAGCGKSSGLMDSASAWGAILDKMYCTKCYPEAEAKAIAACDGVTITTTNGLDGHRVVAYLGIESVEIVIGTGMLTEFMGSLADLAGERSTGFERKLQDAKVAATRILKLKALRLGANAVIGIDLDYTEFSGNRVGLILNGTCVSVQRV